MGRKKKRRSLSPLMKACLAGDRKKVAALIRAGEDVNEATADGDEEHELLGTSFTVSDGGRTALMIAAGDMDEAHPKLVRLLLDAGARVDAVSGSGYTALCRAVAVGSAEVAEMLLAHGADPNQEAMFTPLFCAVENDHLEMVRALLSRGAKVDTPIWTGATPLMETRSEAVAKLLLGRRADVRARDRDGRTALHHVIETLGNRGIEPAAVVKLLLRKGADASARDANGTTPLHLAAALSESGYETVDVLVRAGADVDAKDSEGTTPLLRACELDRVEAAARLLDAGASIEARNGDRKTPLLLAAENGYVDLGCELVSRGARGIEKAVKLARENGRDDFVRWASGEAVAAEELPRAVRELSERAERLYATGEHRRALALYRKVPEAFRDRIYANVSNMGYCLQQLGRAEEARERFERALLLAPEPAHLLKALCYSHWQTKQWDDMERCAARAVELAPDDDYAWQQLAIARIEKGDLRGAVEASDRGLTIAPKNVNLAFNRGLAQWKLGLPEARKNLLAAVKREPSFRAYLPAELGGKVKTGKKKKPAKKKKPSKKARTR